MQKIILQAVILKPDQVRLNIKKTHKYGISKYYEFSDGQIISVESTVDFKEPVPKLF